MIRALEGCISLISIAPGPLGPFSIFIGKV